jgi:hypothetical protein
MKGTPVKKAPGFDPSAAIASANELTAATALQDRPERQDRPENENTKFVNLRLRETDWKRIGKLAVDAGITKAAFCKFATLFIADMIDQGSMSISGGGVVDRRS